MKISLSSYIRPLIASGIGMCFLFTGCFSSGSDSRAIAPDADKNQTLTFSPINDAGVVQILFEDPAIFPAPLYGLTLKECRKQTLPSLAGKARQLLVALSDLSIVKRKSLATDPAIITIQATAQIEEVPIALVAYSWSDDQCLHDFLVWSKDVSLVSPEHKDEHLVLAILDRYVVATVQSYPL